MNGNVVAAQSATAQYKRKPHRPAIRKRDVDFPAAFRQNHKRAYHDAALGLAARVRDVAFGKDGKRACFRRHPCDVRAVKTHPFIAVFQKGLDVVSVQCGRLGAGVHFYRKVLKAKLWQADAFLPADNCQRSLRRRSGVGHVKEPELIYHPLYRHDAGNDQRSHSPSFAMTVLLRLAPRRTIVRQGHVQFI